MSFDIQDIAARVGGGTTVIPTEHPATPQDIATLETKLGVTFPADYKAFLQTIGSLLCQVHEDIWRRPEVGDIGPHWMQTRFELSVYGVCSEVDWMRIEDNTRSFRERHELPLAPVFQWMNTSDCIAFDASGRLVSFMRGEDEATPLDESFTEVLHRLIDEQRGYKDELQAG